MTVERTDLAELARARHLLKGLHRSLHERGSWNRMWQVGDVIAAIEGLEREWADARRRQAASRQPAPPTDRRAGAA